MIEPGRGPPCADSSVRRWLSLRRFSAQSPSQGRRSRPPLVGSEFQVNTYTTSGQGGARVAVDSDGDFVFDRTDDGRTLKLMVVIDEYTRQCLAIHVARRIQGLQPDPCSRT